MLISCGLNVIALVEEREWDGWVELAMADTLERDDDDDSIFAAAE